jgi:hypothetical protein
MIIKEKIKQLTVVGEDTSKRAKISQDKLGKLQYLLTKGLYKDPITAVIAEWVNNGVDSVVQTGKSPIENPVLVKIERENNKHMFSVEDFGVGLDDRDFEDICMNYLESTKEDSNEFIGSWGLGMKSFLSLERSATFICRKNGIERKYLVYEGEEFVNFDLIYARPTTEKSGVKAELVINGWSEYSTFTSKAKQKLAYYDTVALIIDGQVVENTINRSVDFQWSTLNTNRVMHICLKDVYYSIDWEALGYISAINVGVALRFELGEGITPTPSRESYITNEKTKKLILDKIKKVADWFVLTYNDRVKQFTTFLDAYPHLNISDYTLDGFLINPILQYSKHSVKSPVVTGINLKSADFYHKLNRHFFAQYNIAGYLNHGGIMKNEGRRLRVNKNSHIFDKKLTVLVGMNFVGNIKEYLKAKYKSNTLFVRKNSIVRVIDSAGALPISGEPESYRSMLLLLPNNKPNWQSYIDEFDFVESSVISTFKDETAVDSTPIYIKWLEEKKEDQKQLRLANATKGIYSGLNKKLGDVTMAYSYTSLRGVSFKKASFPISSLPSNKFLTVLLDENEPNIDMIKLMINFMKCPNIKFATVGKNERKKVPDIHQFINLTNFMSNCKPFMRLASALVFQRLLDDINELKSFNNGILNKFVKDMKKDREALAEYVEKNLKLKADVKIYEYIKNIADEYKLYDLSLWDKYVRLRDNIKKYDFITLLDQPTSWDLQMNKRYKTLITQILYFRKKYYDDLPEGTEFVLPQNTQI